MKSIGKRKTAVAAAATALGAAVFTGAMLGANWTPAALAMGQQQPPASIYLAPNTVTVQGVAQAVMTNNVSQVTESMNINDTTPKATVRDESVAAAAIRGAMARLGIPSGDVMTFGGGWNGGASQSGMLNVTINIARKSLVPGAVTALANYSPSFVTNSYVNVQQVPQNPAAERQHLFVAALADARAQAELLARDANKSLGPIEAMSTLNPQGFAGGTAGPYPASAVAGGVQNGAMYGFLPSQTAPSLSAQVIVTFALH